MHHPKKALVIGLSNILNIFTQKEKRFAFHTVIRNLACFLHQAFKIKKDFFNIYS